MLKHHVSCHWLIELWVMMLCVVLLQRDMFRGFTLMEDIWDYSKHYCSKAKTALKSPTMNGDNFESALVFSV